jgi:penicillin-binding protein activator
MSLSYPGHTRRPAAAMVLLLTAAVLSACAGRQVSRIEPGAVTDLSGRWNDTDSRLVANELITLSLNAAWARQYAEANGGRTAPVIVGDFRNRTMEHIAVNTFVRDLENAYVNSGAVTVVANRDERREIRGERQDQQEHARADTRMRQAQELGARYILQGEIQAIEDQEGRERVVFYQIDATLTDLESNARVWVGQHKIKKVITRSRFGR